MNCYMRHRSSLWIAIGIIGIHSVSLAQETAVNISSGVITLRLPDLVPEAKPLEMFEPAGTFTMGRRWRTARGEWEWLPPFRYDQSGFLFGKV